MQYEVFIVSKLFDACTQISKLKYNTTLKNVEIKKKSNK